MPCRNRNLDGVAVNTDSVYFIRNPQCNNYNAGTPLPPPATPTPPATLAPTPPGKPNIIQVRELLLPQHLCTPMRDISMVSEWLRGFWSSQGW